MSLKSAKDVSEQRFRALVENISDAIAVLDATGSIIYSGPSTARILGYETGENVGRSALELIHPDDRAEAQRRLAALLTLPGATFTLEYRLLQRDGTWRDMEGIARNLLDEPGVQGVVLTYRDVTERKRAEGALRESEERYRSMVAALDEGIILEDADGTITAVNESAARMLGVHLGQLVGRSAMEMGEHTTYEDGSPFPAEEHPGTVALETGQPQRGVVMGVETNDGAHIWLSINAQPVYRAGVSIPSGVVSSFTDITERKRFEARLMHAAHHDPLTRLPNRSLFMDRLAQFFGRAKRRKQYRFALLFLDFDRFKRVNDTLGHTIGDLLLVAIAERLHGCLRPHDIIARLAGDEFAVLIEEVTEAHEAIQIATRMHDALAAPFVIKRNALSVTASIGIALSATGYDSPEDLLREADAAMYRAKAAGPRQSIVADTEMRGRFVARTQLKTDLCHAIAKDELDVVLAPVVHLATGEIAGFAMQTTWRHPAHGLISAEEFLTIAEETGLRADVDRSLVEAACHQLRAWQRVGNDTWTLAVPIHGANLVNPAFTSALCDTVRRAEVAPHRLILHVAEAIFTEHKEAAAAVCDDLRALGVQIHLDHFGAGSASLLFMRRFAITAVRLDLSFVQMIDHEAERDVLRAVIALAHTVHLQVIADGIENERHQSALAAIGCDFGQGDHFRAIIPK